MITRSCQSPKRSVRSDFSSVTFDGQRRYRAEKEFTITIEADSIDESNEDFSVGWALPA